MSSRTLVYADRSDRGKLRFEGPQRAWFLHQILTQAFEDVAPGEARDAAMITAHGRMVGYLETIATDTAILAHFEPELAPTLPDEIRRYVFATQVDIEDITRSHGLVLIAGEGWRGIATRAASDAVLHPTRAIGEPAGYLWVEAAAVAPTIEALDALGAVPASEDDLEARRISFGVPRWGREMDARTFPQEAGVDEWAVHYNKGCYVGQEAMAKIHFRGKVNRRLARLQSSAQLTVGSDLTIEGRKVGSVTSAGDHRGLALVRYDVTGGTDALAGDVRVTIE